MLSSSNNNLKDSCTVWGSGTDLFKPRYTFQLVTATCRTEAVDQPNEVFGPVLSPTCQTVDTGRGIRRQTDLHREFIFQSQKFPRQVEEKVAGKTKTQKLSFTSLCPHRAREFYKEYIFSRRSHQDANSTLTAIFQDRHTEHSF